jgi:dTDP-D-glucose 4,6-dehydratase
MRKTVAWYLEHLEWCKNVMGEDYKKWLEQNYEK